jgi:tRNA pseudouridine55 synthase
VARIPKGRRVDGIVLLDKPVGCSSNIALQRVKRLFQARKAGHTGSLDPLASGMLPICLGEATKVSAFLLDADKVYRVTAALGVQTATGDAEGAVIHRAPVPELSPARIAQALERFTGALAQVPPMHSALKHHGRRLYELAREGVEVERAPRRIVVHELRLLHQAADVMALEIHCSKGTYVRTFIEDLARDLGTCGHVAELRRLRVGPFRCEQMLSLEALEARASQGFVALDHCLLAPDAALAAWPAVFLDADSAFYLMRGQAVLVPRAPTRGWVRIYDAQQALLGMGEVLEDGRVAPRRLLAPQPSEPAESGDSSC